jgi:hypothetical protein
MYNIIKQDYEEITKIKFSENDDYNTPSVLDKGDTSSYISLRSVDDDILCSIPTKEDAAHLIKALQMAIDKEWWDTSTEGDE